MPDYSNGKIYKIVCNITNKIYIGSTTVSLSQRLAHHRAHCKKISSFEILKGGNFSIFLVEDFPCERREQLLKREREVIEQMDCVNKNIPILLNQEEKRESRNEASKKWRSKNKEKINEYNTNWNSKNADKKKELRRKYYQKSKN